MMEFNIAIPEVAPDLTYDVALAQVLLGTSNAAMIWFGWLMETTNVGKPKSKVRGGPDKDVRCPTTTPAADPWY